MIALALLAQLLLPPGTDLPVSIPLLPPETGQPGSGSRAPFINVKAAPYFACGDGVCDDTGAIQAAIDAASSSGLHGGGTVFIPKGTYLANNLVWKSAVHLMGAGSAVTILQSTSASPLVKLILGATSDHLGSIRDLTLEGNSVGTIGLQLTLVARFSLQNVTIQNFVTTGLLLSGSLIGTAENLSVINSAIGVQAAKNGSTSPNLIRFRDCRIANNTTYGVDWSDGAQIVFDGCEFGGNGTAANASTGTMKFSTMNPVGDGIAAVIKNSWFESNHGHSAIRINTPTTNPSIVVIRDTEIFGGTRTFGVWAAATVQYWAENVAALNAGTADFQDDAATTISFRMNCVAGNSSAGAATTEVPVASGGASGPFIFSNMGRFGPVAFANLGTPANGRLVYCNDCTIANPCAGAGTGAYAKRLNGVWVCN